MLKHGQSQDRTQIQEAPSDSGYRAGITASERNPSHVDVAAANQNALKAADPAANGFPAAHEVFSGLDQPYAKQLNDAADANKNRDLFPGMFGTRMIDQGRGPGQSSIFGSEAVEAVQNGMRKDGDSSALKDLVQKAHDLNGDAGVRDLSRLLNYDAQHLYQGGQMREYEPTVNKDGSKEYSFGFDHKNVNGQVESHDVFVPVKAAASRTSAPFLDFPNENGTAARNRALG